jgi:hypothetical protein
LELFTLILKRKSESLKTLVIGTAIRLKTTGRLFNAARKQTADEVTLQ